MCVLYVGEGCEGWGRGAVFVWYCLVFLTGPQNVYEHRDTERGRGRERDEHAHIFRRQYMGVHGDV